MGETAKDQLTGTLLDDKYRIDRRLGAGAHGVVYVGARHGIAGRVVAKVLHPELARDVNYELRLHRDLNATRKLRHPKLVRVLDVDHLDSDPSFFVTEYLVGETLADVLRTKRTLPPTRVVSIAHQVLSALSALHRAQVLHLGLHPGNVFLVRRAGSPEDIVKVLDAGIARRPEEGDPLGPFAYLAPEQLAGQDVDARTDLFAVGVIMFQALTGQLPFAADSAAEHLEAILTQPAPELAKIRPDLGKHLIRLVDRALSRDRLVRFTRAEDMITALLARPQAQMGFEDETVIDDSPPIPDESEARIKPPRRQHPTLVGLGSVQVADVPTVEDEEPTTIRIEKQDDEEDTSEDVTTVAPATAMRLPIDAVGEDTDISEGEEDTEMADPADVAGAFANRPRRGPPAGTVEEDTLEPRPPRHSAMTDGTEEPTAVAKRVGPNAPPMPPPPILAAVAHRARPSSPDPQPAPPPPSDQAQWDDLDRGLDVLLAASHDQVQQALQEASASHQAPGEWALSFDEDEPPQQEGSRPLDLAPAVVSPDASAHGDFTVSELERQLVGKDRPWIKWLVLGGAAAILIGGGSALALVLAGRHGGETVADGPGGDEQGASVGGAGTGEEGPLAPDGGAAAHPLPQPVEMDAGPMEVDAGAAEELDAGAAEELDAGAAEELDAGAAEEPDAGAGETPEEGPTELAATTVELPEVPAFIERMPRGRRLQLANQLRARARRLFFRRRFALAEAVYRRALRYDVESAATAYGVARALHYQEKETEALPWARRATELGASNPEYHILLAEILATQGDLEGASAALGAALEASPRSRQVRRQVTRLKARYHIP